MEQDIPSETASEKISGDDDDEASAQSKNDVKFVKEVSPKSSSSAGKTNFNCIVKQGIPNEFVFFFS